MSSEIREWRNVGRRLFEAEILPAGQPAVLRGVAEHWPLVQRRHESPAATIEFLKGCNPHTQVEWLAGDARIKGRFFYNDNLSGVNFHRVRGTFGEALSILSRNLEAAAPPALSLQALPLAVHLPALDPQHRLDMLPAEVQATAWIGNALTVAAHFDFNDNIACVAAGRRRFVLFPPQQIENLYIGPLEFTPLGVPISLVDVFDPDLVRYPKFAAAAAAAQVADLGPGDAIFIPYMWWHSVRSLAPFNMLVNYWWNTALKPVIAPFHCLLHAVIAISHLPAAQRSAWQGFFDYLVFQKQGDPAEHVPRERRGILGTLTQEQTAQFTAVVARLLSGSR